MIYVQGNFSCMNKLKEMCVTHVEGILFCNIKLTKTNHNQQD